MAENFRTSFRGYEPSDVDPAMAKLRKEVTDTVAELSGTRVEAHKLALANAELMQRSEEAQQRIVELQREAAHRPAPTFIDLGKNIGSILALAEEEAADMRQAAADAAAQSRVDAEEMSEKLRAAADDYAADARSRADADVAVLLEKARREGDDILDFADRESQTRREEAEALYERQRAESTTAAVDFEQTLAQRRESVAAAFNAELEEHERMLAETVTRRDEAEVEAKRMLDDATQQSRTLSESARAEADQLVSYARNQADRIKTESERELAAATARRDSITSQLANVRQMIGTLGGGTALFAPSAPAQVEAGTSERPVETVKAEMVTNDDEDVLDAEFVDEEDVATKKS